MPFCFFFLNTVTILSTTKMDHHLTSPCLTLHLHFILHNHWQIVGWSWCYCMSWITCVPFPSTKEFIQESSNTWAKHSQNCILRLSQLIPESVESWQIKASTHKLDTLRSFDQKDYWPSCIGGIQRNGSCLVQCPGVNPCRDLLPPKSEGTKGGQNFWEEPWEGSL